MKIIGRNACPANFFLPNLEDKVGKSKKGFSFQIEIDKVKELRRISRERAGQLPTSKTIESKKRYDRRHAKKVHDED